VNRGQTVFTALIAIAALGLFGLVLVRPWWGDMAPGLLRLPVSLVALVLGAGVFLWLRQAPKPIGLRRRRGRLRNRVSRTTGDDPPSQLG
jgi:hypothetical protein